MQRIISTVGFIVGVGGLVILACHGTSADLTSAHGLWQSLLAPAAAHASDQQAAKPVSTIRNPFVTDPAPGTAATEPAVPDVAAPVAPRETTKKPAVATPDRYGRVPTLEPVPVRRMNPYVVDTDNVPAVVGAPPAKAPAAGDVFEPMPTTNRPVEHADRYATTHSAPEADMPPAEIVPVAHAAEVAPDEAPAAAIEDSAVEPPAEPTAEVRDEAPAATLEPVADAQLTTPPVAEPRRFSAPQDLNVNELGEQRGAGVTLQWITPTSVSVDQEATCQLIVKNVSDSVARQVNVEVQLPSGVDPGPTEPKSMTEGRGISWRLGDMSPGATITTHISFTPRQQGDATPRAAVTFTRQVAATIQIVEPQLALAIEGPRESIVGQPTAYQFRVSNNGTGPAMGVAIEVTPGRGLEATNGSQSRYTVGTLSPGESRHVQVMISGSQQGEFDLHGQAFVDQRALDKATHAVRVVQPALALSMDGPKLRFVDRRAAYTITVQNPGPAPIDNVQVVENVPEGFRFVEATSGGNFDRNVRQVSWFVGRLEANETATVGVQLLAAEAGDHRLNVAAKADCGVIGETEAVTRVKGAPHVVIDVTEDDDPVELDGETVYRIRLSNMGSTPARRVQFAAEVPREMQVLEINGPAAGVIKGQQLVFPPIDVMEPGQSSSYDVHVKCKKAGQVRFKAYFRSEDAPDPVLEEEATRIYGE